MEKWRIGIRYRLFFAFLAATCCVVVAMFVGIRMNFERGVFRYVAMMERERLETLARNVEQAYGEAKQWDFLTSSPAAWTELVDGSIPRHPGHGVPSSRFEEKSKGNGHHASKEHDRPPPPPPLPRGDQIFELRVLLLDSQRRVLFGPNEPWRQPPYFMPLTVDRQTVGYLGLIPPKTLADKQIEHFAHEQNRALILIALSIAAGAALLSVPLASRLVRRITTLAAATSRLASGRYDIRVSAGATDELGQLARDFNRLAESLEENEAHRRRWVADISHELRTPLAVLRAEVEAVQDGVRRLTPEIMDGLHGEILHLSRLVDDLYELSLADIGALTYRKENLDLRDLVEQVVAAYRDEFSAHALTVDFHVARQSMMLHGDAERLRQLLNNLLRNTLRYTDPGGTLQIDLGEEGDALCLRLADSAPGVPEEALGHLFERLYRVEGSRSRVHGGAGLGLALCKSIVEAHGGTIDAAPSALGGVKITIILPKDDRTHAADIDR